MKKHALVVGGTRGTGRIIARMLADLGHSVSVIGRRAPKESDQGLPNISFWAVDISDLDQLSSALDGILHRNGRISRLVFLHRYRGDGDAWTGELQTSLTATKQVIERLSDEFEDSGDRSIVIVGSIACQLVAGEQPVGYHVAKAGLLQMVRYYAVALGSKGIRINCVSPGTIVKEESQEFYFGNAELQQIYQTIIPLKRMGTSQEVANVVDFLGSPKASFITGQNLVVDGGLSLQWHESMARNLTSVRDLNVNQEPVKTIL